MEKFILTETIEADIKTVWHTMLDDSTYRQWTTEFNKLGSWYEGKLEQGQKIKFLGPDDQGKIGGMTSEIAEICPYEYISFKHLGFIQDGVEIFDTPEVKKWAPSFENYTFKSEGSKTVLTIYMDIDKEYLVMFSEMWAKAMKKLKTMCEAEI